MSSPIANGKRKLSTSDGAPSPKKPYTGTGFNDMKYFNGKPYTGMSIGGSHTWNYDGGIWKETKEEPDLWKVDYEVKKHRNHSAPKDSGAPGRGFNLCCFYM